MDAPTFLVGLVPHIVSISSEENDGLSIGVTRRFLGRRADPQVKWVKRDGARSNDNGPQGHLPKLDVREEAGCYAKGDQLEEGARRGLGPGR